LVLLRLVVVYEFAEDVCFLGRLDGSAEKLTHRIVTGLQSFLTLVVLLLATAAHLPLLGLFLLLRLLWGFFLVFSLYALFHFIF
jgi:hypothetical protein